MDAERVLLTKIVQGGNGKLDAALASGFTPDRLYHEDTKRILSYVIGYAADRGQQPSVQHVQGKFGDEWIEYAHGEEFQDVLDAWLLNQARVETEQFFLTKLAPAISNEPEKQKPLGDVAAMLRTYTETIEGLTRSNGHSELIPASSVPAEAVRWLWPGFVPLKAMTVVGADPKTGKGLLSVWMAAQMTRGWRRWGERSVAFLGHEDDLGVQVSRLTAAGADLEGVYFLRGKNNKILTLPSDAAEIRRQVQDAGIGCLFIDPINSHCDPHIKTSDDKSMRDVLSPLALIAQECDCIVMVIHHFSKGTSGQKMLYRLGGAMAFSGVARSVLALGRKDPHDDESDESKKDESNSRWLFQTGQNYADDKAPVRFEIEEVEVDVTDGIDSVARFMYVGEDHEVRADEVFTNSTGRGRGRPKDEGLREWIEQQLEGKTEIESQILEDAAHAAGLHGSWRTIRNILRGEFRWSAHKVGTRWVWRGRPSPFLKPVPDEGSGRDE